MGTICGCTSTPLILIPQPPNSLHNNPASTDRSRKKFIDIQPDIEQSQISKMQLNLLQNDLQLYLQEYQLVNGVITRRLTNRPFSELTNSFRKVDLSEDAKNIPQTKTSSYYDQNEHLANENIFIQVEDSQYDTTSHKQNTQQDSCLLSSQSHILNNSIFTERILKFKSFYQKHSHINGIQTFQWNDYHRQSLNINHQDITLLLQSQNDQKVTIVLMEIYQYYQHLSVNLLSFNTKPFGLKIHANGQKRIFPLKKIGQKIQNSQIFHQLTHFSQSTDITQLTYLLTGWIPQKIRISQIKNIIEVLQRISNNLIEGHTLVTLTSLSNNQQFNVLLNYVDFQQGLISFQRNKSPPQALPNERNLNEQVINIELFPQLFDVINMNWNPTIYDISVKRQGKLQNRQTQINKYHLIIPPSKDDIQIRLLLEKHHHFNTRQNQQNLVISLFQYENSGIEPENNAIRTMIVKSNVFSDVFIFQSCKEKTQYILKVYLEDQVSQEEIFYSLTLFSFVDMYFDVLNKKDPLKTIQVTKRITPQHFGSGINSPYFAKNLQICLEVQPQKQLLIAVGAPDSLIYQICLIPDANMTQNLLKISLETIINSSLLSNQKNGNGTFSFKTSCKHYILMLNSYTEISADILFKLTLFGNTMTNPTLQIHEGTQMEEVFFKQNIKWAQSNTGPRKRLKSNSVNVFQPAAVFSQFFNNPLVDKQLSAGKYQFFCQSQTYKEYFDSLDDYDEKNCCEPPALSLAIFQMKKQKQQFKIIQDDAFYVPFGVGFWSPVIELQQGFYRFITPQMQKCYAKGTFGIIKC